jgi:hypothetical protein
MRILLALTVIVVFVAGLLFDTAALMALLAYCVTGGYGAHPAWLAVEGGGVALAAVLLFRRPRADVKKARVTKRAPGKKSAAAPPSRGKAAPRRTVKAVK